VSEFVQVSKVGELEDGAMRAIDVAGREILLARVGDHYYAVDNRCPHMGARLAGGSLQGTVVTCPRHGSQFDLNDGRVLRWLKGTGVTSKLAKVFKAPKGLVTHQVKVEGDEVLVEIRN